MDGKSERMRHTVGILLQFYQAIGGSGALALVIQ